MYMMHVKHTQEIIHITAYNLYLTQGKNSFIQLCSLILTNPRRPSGTDRPRDMDARSAGIYLYLLFRLRFADTKMSW